MITTKDDYRLSSNSVPTSTIKGGTTVSLANSSLSPSLGKSNNSTIHSQSPSHAGAAAAVFSHSSTNPDHNLHNRHHINGGEGNGHCHRQNRNNHNCNSDRRNDVMDCSYSLYDDDIDVAPLLRICCCCCNGSQYDNNGDETNTSDNSSYYDNNSLAISSKNNEREVHQQHVISDVPQSSLSNNISSDTTSTASSTKTAPLYMNRNVAYYLLIVFVTNIGIGCHLDTSILSGYVYILSGNTDDSESQNKNQYVGFMECTRAVSFLVMSTLLSSNKTNNPNATLKLGGILAFIIVAVGSYMVPFLPHEKTGLEITLGLITMLFSGAMHGVIDTTALTVFVKSSSGTGLQYLRFFEIIRFLSSSFIGPLLTILLFRLLGTTAWNVSDLGLILMVGLAFQTLPGFLLCLMNIHRAKVNSININDDEDEYSSGLEIEEASSCRSRNKSDIHRNGSSTCSRGSMHRNKERCRSSISLLSTKSDNNSFNSNHNHHGNHPSKDAAIYSSSSFRPIAADIASSNNIIAPNRLIPVILSLQSILMSIGSGLTINFFPLFFYSKLEMSPIAIQSLYMIVPWVILLVKKMSLHCVSSTSSSSSPVENCLMVVVLFKLLGVASLVHIAYHEELLGWLIRMLQSPDDDESDDGLAAAKAQIIIPLYIIRTGFINGTAFIEDLIFEKSLIDATAAKSTRAAETERIGSGSIDNSKRNNNDGGSGASSMTMEWKMVNNFCSRFSWAISVAIGGVLIDTFGYMIIIKLTAVLQSVALGLLVGLQLYLLLVKYCHRYISKEDEVVGGQNIGVCSICCCNGIRRNDTRDQHYYNNDFGGSKDVVDGSDVIDAAAPEASAMKSLNAHSSHQSSSSSSNSSTNRPPASALALMEPLLLLESGSSSATTFSGLITDDDGVNPNDGQYPQRPKSDTHVPGRFGKNDFFFSTDSI